MSDYRAYIIGQDGHFHDFKVLDAVDDQDALKAANQFVNGHDVEVWHLDRKLGVLKSVE